jgi:hypothetical protein
MQKTSHSQKFVVALVSAAVASTVGIVVVASATDSAVVVCSSKTSGALRYSKDGACKLSESKMTLNEKGATGAIGATGATGATGSAGASGGYPASMELVNITSTHTLTLTDIGKLLVSQSGTVVTVPTNASVALAIGARIDFAVYSSFLYFDPASGVTLNAGTSRVEVDSGTFQVVTLVKIATNEWILLKTVDEN